MKKLILVCNDAQACGKTSLALIVDEYLGRKGVRKTLAITSPEQELPRQAELMDFEEGFGMAEMVELIDQTDVLIVDVSTDGNEEFGSWCREHSLDDILSEVDAELTIIVPVCDDAEVLRGAAATAEIYSGLGEFLVVRCPLLADVEETWENSPSQRALSLLGARVMEAPKLGDAALDQIESLELDLPLAMTQRSLLPRFLRNELLAWEVACADQLNLHMDLLMPRPEELDDLHTESAYGRSAKLLR
jgi:hypothetical protein